MKATSGKWRPACKVLLFAIVGTIVGLSGIWCPASVAQTPPITASGLNTQISGPTTLPSGQTQYNITGGTRPGGGTNLFHSFGNFGVPDNNIANFLNNTGLPTSNILGRVTGGNISNIFGAIQTTGFGNANLFLINPAGFLFGPNAAVNVGGMVAFTSADYLRLADGAFFNAIPNANTDALLSAAPVAAFGFLGSTPGAITVQGSQLSVADGMGISLIGGSINIQSGTLANGTVQPAHLSAPNGQINVTTTASPGEFLFDGIQAGGLTPFGQFDAASLVGPNINGVSFTSFGSLHLAPGSMIDTSQLGNSKVSIHGGQLVVEIQNALLRTDSTTNPGTQNNILLAPGSSIMTAATSTDQGPDVEIVADNIHLIGTPFDPSAPFIPSNISTETRGSGAAGNISVTANQNLELFSATITSVTGLPGTGNAGNVALTSTQGHISATSLTIVSSQGTAGSVSLSAPQGDVLLDSSVVFTQVLGPGILGADGGAIHVTAKNLTMSGLGLIPASIEGDNFTPQIPGNITITLTGSLSMDGGSTIQTISRGPAIRAADVNITAHDVNIMGGGVVNAETQSSGVGGQVNVSTNSLQLTAGGQIRSGSNMGADPETGDSVFPSGPGGTINIHGPSGFAPSVLIDGTESGIFTNAVGTGAGGNTNISAQSLTVQNGGTISAATSGTTATATGGTITVNATDHVTMTNGGSITASSTGPGNTGDIQINAGNQFTMSNSSVTTEATQSGGGIIKITTNPSGTVELSNSKISASVLDGAGGGGSVNIDPQFVILQNSQILAQAIQGAGGNINITITNGGLFLPDGSSRVSASSQFGQNGAVTIQQPIAPAGGKIQPLGKAPLQVTALLSQRCAAIARGEVSSFVVAGRDTLPVEPGGWLPSPLAFGTPETGAAVQAGDPTLSSESSDSTLLSLRRLPSPSKIAQLLGKDWVTDCTS